MTTIGYELGVIWGMSANSGSAQCGTRLNAPRDKKRASTRVNWLVRQLRDVDGDDVIVRAFWLGRGGGNTGVLDGDQVGPKVP